MWDYRVIKRSVQGEDVFGIYECFFDENGRIWACTENPEPLVGGSIRELVILLADTLAAVTEQWDTIIDIDDIPQEGAINPLDDIDLTDESQWIKLKDVNWFGKEEEDGEV